MGRALAAIPAHEWDAFLLQTFPGKTLEELDHIDVLRLMRAVRVQRIDQVEQLHRASLDPHGQERLRPADWQAIKRHGLLLRKYFGEENLDDGE